MVTRWNSLSLVVPLVVIAYHSLSLFVIRCHSLYHLLSLVVTHCHSLSLVVPLVVTRCTTRCHSLSLVVPLVVTRCTTRLPFYKRPFKIDVCKNCAIFTGKHLRWSLFVIKLQACKPVNLLERDSSTSVFLWILLMFKNSFFYRTPSVAAF